MNLASQCFWESVDGTPEDDLARKRRWRIAASGVDSLREAAKKFEGTHNFHNFTLGREFRDRSNNRYMKSIEVGLTSSTSDFPHQGTQISEPAVYGETEWISVLFLGQSFMLHQVSWPVCFIVLH
jgi:tRNA pseudouridine38-40 synthase